MSNPSKDFSPPPVSPNWRDEIGVIVPMANTFHARKLMAACKRFKVAAHAEVRVTNQPIGNYRIWSAEEHRFCVALLWELVRGFGKGRLESWLDDSPRNRRKRAQQALIDLAFVDAAWHLDDYPLANHRWLRRVLGLAPQGYIQFLQQSEALYYRKRQAAVRWGHWVALGMALPGYALGEWVWHWEHWFPYFVLVCAGVVLGFGLMARLESGEEGNHDYTELLTHLKEEVAADP